MKTAKQVSEEIQINSYRNRIESARSLQSIAKMKMAMGDVTGAKSALREMQSELAVARIIKSRLR